MALAKGARMQGATHRRGRRGHRRRCEARRPVTGVAPPYGDIEAEYVVNCAGMWARQLGAKAGVNIPLQAAEHYYLITEPIPGMSRRCPVLEDPRRYGYFREEVGGLMVGLFEPVCAPWNVGGVPDDFSFGEIPPDWDRMGPYVEKAMSRVPISIETGVKKFFCGPESFTPDLQPIVGEAPELKNYFVAAGLNSIGIITGGGLGRVMAHWIINGRPDVDVTGIQHRPVAHLSGEPRVPAHAHGRVARHGVPVPLPDAIDADRARRETVPAYDRLAARGATSRTSAAGRAPTGCPGPATDRMPGSNWQWRCWLHSSSCSVHSHIVLTR